MPRRSSLVNLAAKAALVALLAAFALTTAAVHPPAAQASTPCWKTLLNDWYDGRIDKTYPVHCYREALKHLPADVQTYSSAHDDISRALQTAIALKKKKHQSVGSGTLVPPEKGTNNGGGGSAGGGSGNGGSGGSGTGTTPVTSPGNSGNGGLAGKLNPSSPSSVPVPLLVLGGLALLLVAAGAAGLVAKRVQARRAAP
jgi:hypothetical protein